MLPPTRPSGTWVWNITAVRLKPFPCRNVEIPCNRITKFSLKVQYFLDVQVSAAVPFPKHRTEPDVSGGRICTGTRSWAREEGPHRICLLHQSDLHPPDLEDTPETSSSEGSGRGCTCYSKSSVILKKISKRFLSGFNDPSPTLPS